MALTQISTDGVKNDAVTAGKIPANAVGTSEIAADAVTGDQLANDSVDSEHLVADSIDAEHIAADSVLAEHIADNAVTQAQIAGESVDEAKMIISNAGSNGQFLQKQSGNTGGLTWATPTDNTVGGATGVDFNDTVKARWGTGNDLSIYHDGDHNRIDSSNGNIYLRHGTDNAIMTVPDGLVALYHDDVKRLETLDDGVEVVGHLHLGDNNQIRLGYPTSPGAGDLKLYHDATDSYITSETGQLYIDVNAGSLRIESDSSWANGKMAHFIRDGAVELYHNNVKTFETTATGISVTGKIEVSDDLDLTVASYNGRWDKSANALELDDNAAITLGTGADCKMYHDGGSTWILNNLGHFYIRNNVDGDDGSNIYIQAKSGEGSIACIHDGEVKLYYDGAVKAETTSGGVSVSGYLDLGDWAADGGEIRLGASQDLQLYHKNGHSYVRNSTGQLHFRGNDVRLTDTAGYEYLLATQDSSIDLYYDGSKKFETTSTGVHTTANSDIRFANGDWTGDTAGKIQHHGNSLYIQIGSNGCIFRSNGGTDRWRIVADGHWVPQANNTYDIGDSTNRVRNLYVNDAHFSNKGSQNSVDGTWGDWTLQEGEDDIFMLNNRTGKKYKMALQEVS